MVTKPLVEVALLFSKLGLISFGGPAAHIALMETETVTKRGWLTREYFLDLLATTNLVPGPNATEMASHIGFVHAGWPGLFVGGVSFTLPATLITLGIAWAYVRYGALPQGQALFYGINPVIIAIVLAAVYRLGRSAIKTVPLGGLALASLAATLLLPVDPAFILLGAGAMGVLLELGPKVKWPSPPPQAGPGSVALWLLVMNGGALASLASTQLVQLGLFFLKVGALLFGSGMVLFAFIQRDVVTGYGWLSQKQLVDAIAVGQMTPGPVLSSATFIGYLVAGLPGAIVSTVAIFAPAFAIMAAVGPGIPRLRRIPVVQAFLKGVNAAVVAAILSIVIVLARSALLDVWTVAIAVLALLLLLRYGAETWQLVLGGAAIGLIHYLLV